LALTKKLFTVDDNQFCELGGEERKAALRAGTVTYKKEGGSEKNVDEDWGGHSDVGVPCRGKV